MSVSPRRASFETRELVVIGLLTLAALALRVAGMGQSLFGDELFTYADLSGRGVAEVVRHVANGGVEDNPPLFYVLAELSSRLGPTEVWMRLPSVLLGTLTAYALLPRFPTQAPRFLFPAEDLPRFETAVRRLNLWILDHGDIRSSIFPSGHVAFAFSSAFAIRMACPARRRVAAVLLVLAGLVWLDTIYGRYHYAADGLAGLIASAVPIGGLALWRASARRSI